MSAVWWLRFKRFVAVHGRVLVAVLLLVGAASIGAAVWLDAHPQTEHVAATTNEQTIGTDVETSALVTGNTSLWERGERLEDRPLYLMAASPELRLTTRTRVPGTESARVRHGISLVYRASYDGETFWEQTETVNRQNTTEGVAVTNVTVNASSVRQRARAFEEELSGTGDVDVFVRVNTTYSTGEYAGRLNASAPLTFTQRGYALGGSLEESRTHVQRVTRTETVPYDESKLRALVGVGVVALLAAGGVAAYLRRDPDADEFAQRLERAAYEEWISTGSLAEIDQQVRGDARYIETDSLTDLVNVGIDANTRTIHDPSLETYAVVDRQTVYYFDDSPPEPASDLLVPDAEPSETVDEEATRPQVDPDPSAHADEATVGSATTSGADDDEWEEFQIERHAPSGSPGGARDDSADPLDAPE